MIWSNQYMFLRFDICIQTRSFFAAFGRGDDGCSGAGQGRLGRAGCFELLLFARNSYPERVIQTKLHEVTQSSNRSRDARQSTFCVDQALSAPPSKIARASCFF